MKIKFIEGIAYQWVSIEAETEYQKTKAIYALGKLDTMHLDVKNTEQGYSITCWVKCSYSGMVVDAMSTIR